MPLSEFAQRVSGSTRLDPQSRTWVDAAENGKNEEYNSLVKRAIVMVLFEGVR